MGNVDIRYLAGTYTNSFDADGGAFPPFDSLYTIKPGDFLERDGNSILNIHATVFGSIQTHAPLQGIAKSESDRKILIRAFCSLPNDGSFSMSSLHQLFDGFTFSVETMSIRCTSIERHIGEMTTKLVLGFYEDLCQLFGPEPVFVEFLECFWYHGLTARGYRWKSLQEEIQLCSPDSLHLNRMEFLGRAAETTERQAAALFLTVDRHLGIGPRGMQQGDVVCIGQGCRVPLVLRLHGTYYRLVGPAYVSGLMRDVWADKRNEKMVFEPIQLV